jgi:molybdenum cofactor biosynthesis enzyme MoaA
MPVPVSSVHYLRFILSSQTDGVLLTKKKRTGKNANVPELSELTELLSIFVSRGVQKIRLVGDDPALRQDLPDLIKLIAAIRGVYEVVMTTQGLGLSGRMEALVDNGLKGINFNLDTLKRTTFKKMTGQKVKDHSEIWAAIEEALEAELKVKLNVVLHRGVNDQEVSDFVELTREYPIQVRFLEWNTMSERIATPKKFVSTHETLSAIKPPLVPAMPTLLDGPAMVYTIPKYKGSVGFIPNVTEHFCSTCTRIGITDQGDMTSCIFGHGLNLIKHKRSPKGDESVTTFIDRVLRRKSSLSAKLNGFTGAGKSSDSAAQVPALS